MEESKNLFTDRLKKTLELNWMNQLSDRMYQNALINLKDALTQYRFGRSSDSTVADRPKRSIRRAIFVKSKNCVPSEKHKNRLAKTL